MIHADVIVYQHPKDCHRYVALIGTDWQTWPAVEGGWADRQRFPEPTNDALLKLLELPPANARLALRLSGADRD